MNKIFEDYMSTLGELRGMHEGMPNDWALIIPFMRLNDLAISQLNEMAQALGVDDYVDSQSYEDAKEAFDAHVSRWLKNNHPEFFGGVRFGYFIDFMFRDPGLYDPDPFELIEVACRAVLLGNASDAREIALAGFSGLAAPHYLVRDYVRSMFSGDE